MFKILGIASLFIVGIVAYIFFTQQNTIDTATLPGLIATPTPVQDLVEGVGSSERDKLRLGGNSYSDKNGVYVVLYPNDYKIDSQNNGQYIRFVKTGATQQGQTELYDGVMVVFESVSTDAMTLDAWVDERIVENTQDGTQSVVEPKKSITVTGYPGYTYTVRGLGTSRYYVIQKDSNSKNAVSITTLVADPQNKGYQKEIDSILATIELLK